MAVLQRELIDQQRAPLRIRQCGELLPAIGNKKTAKERLVLRRLFA